MAAMRIFRDQRRCAAMSVVVIVPGPIGILRSNSSVCSIADQQMSGEAGLGPPEACCW